MKMIPKIKNSSQFEIHFMIVGVILVCASVLYATESKIRQHLFIGPVMEQKYATATQRDRELQCLAINIYREAGYEPFEGKVAVAQVTMNRVSSEDFPNDVCQVVYQKRTVFSRTVCQFSWYCDAAHRDRAINHKAYQESYEVAQRVLLENYRLPGLTDALYYHADYVRPGWDRTKDKIAKIGTHIFYSPRDQL